MELLNVCMKESMLTNPALLQSAIKLIKLCETFANFILVSDTNHFPHTFNNIYTEIQKWLSSYSDWFQKMHRHANEAELGLSSLANVTSLNDVLLTSPGDVFFHVIDILYGYGWVD